MYSIKYVFSQITSFLDRSKFNRLVAKYNGDSYVKSFTCWNQLLVLMFGQLCQRKSLRDLSMAIGAHRDKLYHLGFPKGYHLRKVKYKILEARSYCIDDNFPIINSEAFIDGKIPLGVKKISYSVDLTYLDYEIIPKTLDMLEG